MHSNLDGVLHASLEDELCVLGCELASLAVGIRWTLRCLEDHQECLDNVVAVHIHSELHDVAVQGLNHLHQVEVVHGLSGILQDQSCEFVDQGLDGSCAMNVQRNVHYLTEYAHHNLMQGIRVCHFNDFLAKVIAKLVGHDARQNW